MRNMENNELYNVPLIRARMRELKMSKEKLAELSGLSLFSVHALCAGHLGTLAKLKQGFDALGLDWNYATQAIDESDFHRAVLRTGNSRAIAR